MWCQFILLALVLLLCKSFEQIESYRFEPNTLTWTNNTGCPNDQNNSVHFLNVVTQISENKYNVNGKISVAKPINGPIRVRINDCHSKI